MIAVLKLYVKALQCTDLCVWYMVALFEHLSQQITVVSQVVQNKRVPISWPMAFPDFTILRKRAY